MPHVLAPMTRAFSPGGVPGPDVAAYYRRRADNGVGLIITEGTVISHRASSGNPAVPNFYGEEALAGWTEVLAAVRGAGGQIMPQLWHVGALRKPGSDSEVDLVAIARALLVDPAWAAKTRDGRFEELVPFNPEATKTLY